MTTNIITAKLVPEHLRNTITADLFGAYFPLQLEPFIFSMASRLSDDYGGGYWRVYTLGNGGFYMGPDRGGNFLASSPKGWEGFMSPDAFGISATMFAYSNLSFGSGQFAETCGEHYHLLRNFVMGHAEAAGVLAAID